MYLKKKIVLGSIILMFVGFIAFSQVSYAMDPPTKEQLNSYKKDGSYNLRLEHARALENNIVDPKLLKKLNQNNKSTNSTVKSSKIKSVSSSSTQTNTSSNSVPVNWGGGLPSTGNVKVAVILIDFPDYPHNISDTVTQADSKFFGNGNPQNYPYESLKNYYLRSSYGKLNITGTVYGWYTATHLRSYYANLSNSGNFNYGNEALIMEALKYYDGLGADFSQYDNDNNGYIDGLYVKWTGPDNGWANFWWAYQNNWNVNPSFSVDGKKLNKFVWSWYSNTAQGSPSDSIRTDIHETGHLLGLPDYYDYKTGVGPDGGIGGLDMMDSNWGDHNCFSKYILGWISPSIVSSGSKNIVLNPSGTSTDAVIIMPGTITNPYQEYFMVQFRERGSGNDPLNYIGTDSGLGWSGDYPNDGLLIWHVDATLNSNGTDYLYDNSFTTHRLLSLMEADGLNEIESDYGADAGDYYVPGSVFSPYSNPNSYNYLSEDTGVFVDNIVSTENTIMGRFAVVVKAIIDLNESVDSSLNWTSGGSINAAKKTISWFGENSITHDGTDAAQSGTLNNNQLTWIQTTVSGPGSINFWWKVSSEYDSDKLVFCVDGIIKDSISGIKDWGQETFKIDEGTHILTWMYQKDGSGFAGNDTGWLDEVEWVQADITPPTAISDTKGGIYNSTKTVTLSMNEDGNIYYSLNGTNPNANSYKYTSPIIIKNTTILKYLSIDLAGNPSQIYTEIFTIDLKSPTITATPTGGIYNLNKTVALNINEIGTIYYTLNGSSPSTKSYKYIKPFIISKSTTVKYFGVDIAGNISPVYTQKYTINRDVLRIIKTTPYNMQTNVSRAAPIKIQFSESILPYLNLKYIKVKNLNTGTYSTISTSIINSTMQLNVKNNRYNTWYQLTIPAKAVKDHMGNYLLANYTIKFKIKPS